MAIKFFCDECGKEAPDDETVRIFGLPRSEDRGRNLFLCYSCWKENWKPKKKRKNNG